MANLSSSYADADADPAFQQSTDKYQTLSINQVFHGLGQKDDLRLLRMHHSFSLSTFSLNVFTWVYNSNQKSKTDHCPRKHLNVPHQLMPAYKPPFPFAWAFFINSDSSTWNLLCINSTSWSICVWKSAPFALIFFNSASIFLLDDSFAFVHVGKPMINSLNRASIPPLSPTSSILPCLSSFAFPLFFSCWFAAFSSSCARTRGSKTHFMCPLIQRLHLL